ncbi:anaphase-promoting complex, cyclosome, subunit 4-domain-containing protein [Mycena floridula]|nr:anaphase-promoting complex, cyclosome, subunit 4-domain-containing protein [Mycena floridula]
MEFETNAFAILANVALPSSCRLLASACCPDKDLVVLITRLGGLDRLSLWKIQGTKKWEVDISTSDSMTEHIVDVSWSPDGQTIAVAHDPPSITLHSVQDGHEERILPPSTSGSPYNLTAMWWFRQEKKVETSTIPDIFKRNDVITGTAHSVLKTLPLLDSMQEDSQKLAATDIFAFQGSQTRTNRKSTLPDVIKAWPTFQPDYLAASMASPQNLDIVDEPDDGNKNSILAVADTHCRIHFYLDGTYPLGVVKLGGHVQQESITSLIKHPKLPLFFAHRYLSLQGESRTLLSPICIRLPSLEKRHVRDLAKLSSTARELIWYVIRVVKDMRSVWFGSDSFPGAREMGPKWIHALEAKQREQFGQEEPNPILDLTALLVSGKPSESLADFFGSGDLMSERGIEKWESTVTESLIKLRDMSEKRVAPACQRFHLVLEELYGCSQLPYYSLFNLEGEELRECLVLANRAITLSSWLASVARRELSRFKDFISWVRYEIIAINPSSEITPILRHDILEVNKYLMGGLVVSPIDKWFMGPVPRFSPQELGIPSSSGSLADVLKRARQVATTPGQVVWKQNVKPKDLNHLDRNIDALVQDLATRCRQIFDNASGATARTVEISGDHDLAVFPGSAISKSLMRERTTVEEETGQIRQYLAHLVSTSENRSFLCVVRQRLGNDDIQHAEVALLECGVTMEEGQSEDLELLDAEFFDEEVLVIMFRLPSKSNTAFIATVGYADLEFRQDQTDATTRERLMQGAVESWKAGQLISMILPIKRARSLVTCKTGPVSLAVNGRAGRRVACVLDDKGLTLETFDIEGDGDVAEGDSLLE